VESVTYYPLPDIPADVTPEQRRFCEQVRSTIAKLEKYGQPIEVHQPFYAEAALSNGTFPIVEFPVYRADVPVELLYATWTTPIVQNVRHDLRINWRSGEQSAARDLLEIISATATATTDWQSQTPKRFAVVNKGRKVLAGQILTIEMEDTSDGVGTLVPWGLLSMYLRRAEVI
jgi:hypothetical protein